MSHSTLPTLPFLCPSGPRGCGGWPRRSAASGGGSPPAARVQIGLVAIVVAASAAGGYYGWSHQEASQRQRVAAAWTEFQDALRKDDLDGIRRARRVHAANPTDPTANRYKSMLDRGEADRSAELVSVVLHDHLRILGYPRPLARPRSG